MQYKLLNPQAKIPTRAHATDAGLDLCSLDAHFFEPGKRILVDTGVSVAIPEGYVGLLIARSSLCKKGLELTNGTGVIDSDYRGSLRVSLAYTFEAKDSPYIAPGERIAQLVIVPILRPQLVEHNGTKEEWENTDRGAGGFGSTGAL